ncbi:hypothetical protein WICPIJ_001156 [Wickerhamomyces pijperi]|uniref:Uncharacterized protein n=1 Tax=Wickerhamomyces pijperi TaxID=599730 RepID=A0A9P8QBG5_WICPI|nr:hypothetical protein WICPIJ_001156 [Wickerhamomyces pijperi]
MNPSSTLFENKRSNWSSLSFIVCLDSSFKSLKKSSSSLKSSSGSVCVLTGLEAADEGSSSSGSSSSANSSISSKSMASSACLVFIVANIWLKSNPPPAP